MAKSNKQKAKGTAKQTVDSKRQPQHKKQNPFYYLSIRYWQRGIWQKIWVSLSVFVLLFVSGMYAIAQWYIIRNQDKPLVYGATFIPSYAESFGLNAEETMAAMIDDLGFKHLRLVSYWSSGEKERGVYDFSYLDWQLEKARQNDVKITLAIGLRQPRWPECHMPEWARPLPKSEWEQPLMDYIRATVERYRNDPIIESWQLENEYFLRPFGICPDYSRERLVAEYDLVKSLDDTRPLIVTRSNNALGWAVGEPRPDISAVSIYKRVWDRTITKRYVEYPFPAWFYANLAGWNELLHGSDTFIHELQAESWLPDGFEMHTASTEELYKSFSPDRLEDRLEFAEATGMKRIDLWGPEWWYYMKEKRGAPELWETGKRKLLEALEANEDNLSSARQD